MAGSLYIVSHIDNLLGMPILAGPTNPLITQWLNEASDTLFKLAISRWQTPAVISQAERDLRSLAELIVPGRGCNGMLSDDDILLFPYLRALSIVANVTYPVQVNNYRLGMALRATVQLHDTIAL